MQFNTQVIEERDRIRLLLLDMTRCGLVPLARLPIERLLGSIT